MPETISYIVLREVALLLHDASYRPYRWEVEWQGVVEKVSPVLVILACSPLICSLLHDQPGVNDAVRQQIVDQVLRDVLHGSHGQSPVGLLSPFQASSALEMAQQYVAASMVGGGRPAGMRTAMTLGKEKDLQKMGLDPNSQKRQEGGLKGEHREREAVSSVQQRLVYPHLYSNSIL